MKINLIMPMGGGGTRFGIRGYELPKPLIPIYEKPFFYWATKSISKFCELESLTFVVLKDHVEKFSIDKEIKEYFPEAEIVVIPEILKGAVLTCLEGVKNINNNYPVIFNDCDHLFLCNSFYEFLKTGDVSEIDGGLLTFKSDEDKFSFVAYGDDGYVNRTVEKEVISNDAICGAYYFKNAELFKKASEVYLEKCSYNEFFVSGVYNILIDDFGGKVKSFTTDVNVSFGTPDEYEEAQSDLTYNSLI